MTLLKVKSSVRPHSLFIAAAIINAAQTLGLADMLITSGNDGAHMDGSRHYAGDALDARTKHLAGGAKHDLRAAVQKRLGKRYQAILEHLGKPNEHLHVEFDP